ncbi:type II secretion system protein J [Candidatus Omnitrophota bacterium]
MKNRLVSRDKVFFYLIKAGGFTLIEIMFAMAIFALAACGTMSLFISAATIKDSAGYSTLMSNRTRQEIEDAIWQSDFSSLNSYVLLPPAVPNDTSLVCYVTNHNSGFCPNQGNLKEVRLVLSYREKERRVRGEDQNLNGVLDGGEDLNGDGRLSSPVEIVTYVARR